MRKPQCPNCGSENIIVSISLDISYPLGAFDCQCCGESEELVATHGANPWPWVPKTGDILKNSCWNPLFRATFEVIKSYKNKKGQISIQMKIVEKALPFLKQNRVERITFNPWIDYMDNFAPTEAQNIASIFKNKLKDLANGRK